jgi:hippurate hydrolase
MIEDGLFGRFPVDAVYALHNWPSLPAGTIGLNPGPMMAGIDRFTLRIVGVGGHGGHPHQTIDPIVAAAHIVAAIQSIVSKNVNPLDSGVVGLHYMHAGAPSALSVVPETVDLAGMVKWYRKPVQEILERRLREVVANCAAMFGTRAELAYEPLYPPTINSADEAETVARVAERLIGKQNVRRDLEPSMGSEDFAFMLLEKPGAYFRLGTGSGCPLHNPKYDFNDGVIPLGAAIFSAIVEDSLADA